MCCGSAARVACFCRSKDQALRDLEAHPSFAKPFWVSRRKMGLLCPPTLKQGKAILKSGRKYSLEKMLEINIWK